MERALIGAIDVASEESIWLCTMCNSCTERCQLGVDPASVICSLRNLAAEEGNSPDHFLSEARLFMETGMAFPMTGLTRKLRKEMGLDDLEVDERALEDVGKIVERTRLGRLRIE